VKCARIGCIAKGVYQPMIRIKASIILSDGKETLATIRLPMTVCLRHRLESCQADILALVPPPRMQVIIEESRKKTGMAPNPDRTDVVWVRITGKPPNVTLHS
jgi:hypothetical protein